MVSEEESWIKSTVDRDYWRVSAVMATKFLYQSVSTQFNNKTKFVFTHKRYIETRFAKPLLIWKSNKLAVTYSECVSVALIT